jgi:predicted dehydrogenase
MTSPRYNVLIIGAGSMGAFYDNPGSKNVLTHAHAFSMHEGFNVLGFVDKDMQKASQAASLWGRKAFDSIGHAFGRESVDIVCVSVPDKLHYEVLKEIADFGPKLVFAEKPLAISLSEAKKIRDVYNKLRIPVCINYKRRFVPEFQKLKVGLAENGGYLTGTGYYGKGFIHNGSHLIDLLSFFLGEFHVQDITGKSFDYADDDPSISAVLYFQDNKPFSLQAIDCRMFTIFELDLIFEQKRIRIKDLGFRVEEFELRESHIFSGYYEMTQIAGYETQLGSSMLFSASNIYNHLSIGEALMCSIDDGYRTLELCSRILEKAS